MTCRQEIASDAKQPRAGIADRGIKAFATFQRTRECLRREVSGEIPAARPAQEERQNRVLMTPVERGKGMSVALKQQRIVAR